MAEQIHRYGLKWTGPISALKIEMDMIRQGGRWKHHTGEMVGEGLFFHMKRFQQILWPEKKWHRWNELELDCFLKYRTIVELGPACVAGHTRILNPITGDQPTIEELTENQIYPIVQTLEGPRHAGIPFVKGVAQLYEVVLENGHRFEATDDHRVLGQFGYVHVGELSVGQKLRSPPLGNHVARSAKANEVGAIVGFNMPINSEDAERNNVMHMNEFTRRNGSTSLTHPSITNSCCKFGAFPTWSTVISSPSSPVRVEFSCGLMVREPFNPAFIGTESPSPGCFAGKFHKKSTASIAGTLDCSTGCSMGMLPAEIHIFSENTKAVRRTHFANLFGIGVLESRTANRTFGFDWAFSRSCHCGDTLHHHNDNNKSNINFTRVVSIRKTKVAKFYDISVPGPEHYFAEGLIHHNSSGKTNSAATNVLADWLNWSDCTTGLFCSTTRERLEDRVWGEVKKYFRLAKERYPWLSGQLIEGRQRILLDERLSSVDGRDFRNGLIGVPAKKGDSYVGLGDFIGIKNKRVRLVGDELHLLPAAFVESISNLDKNPDLKVIGLGNPKDTLDALGRLAEPAAHLGGWDGGIDQTPGTKTWEIRRPNGICIQLPGSDSPNLDGQLGIPLINQEQIDRDVAFYGRDSLWFTMFNEGRMPRGHGSKRVLTRQACEKFGAFDPPIWKNPIRTRIAFLDAAYRGVGGDRCVFGELQFGDESSDDTGSIIMSSILDQRPNRNGRRQIVALIETRLVPINVSISELPEDQIVQFVKEQCAARDIPPENFYFDSGMRTSLVSAFGRLWSNAVNSIDCGGKPSERKVSVDIETSCRDYFFNFITELWFSVRLAVEAGQFRGLTDEVCNEFCSREWAVVGANKIQIEPKYEMKKKIGRSPDLADAVAVGLHGALRRGFVIATLSGDRRRRDKLDWRSELKNQARDFSKAGDLVYD